MAKTVLRAKKEGIQFFMNSESSSPTTRQRNRFRLFMTTNFGRDKAGWVQVGSTVGQALLAIKNDSKRFDACKQAFESKRPHQYITHAKIRGAPGKWEGAAFPTRVTHGRDEQAAQGKVGS